MTRSHAVAVLVLLVCVVTLGANLDRYPGFYIDDVFFTYPALQALHGHAFAYAPGHSAPYASAAWGYHGPLLPNLDLILFKIFGFSTALSRLPDFLGAWLAALAVVLFLNRRGYRFAGLIFAVLWLGDRTVLEVMYGRMDGLGLLFLVLAFVSLENAWHTRSRRASVATGLLAGLASLCHPLCVLFLIAGVIFIGFRLGLARAADCLGGSLANVPLLLVLWHFHPVEAIHQFFWHASLYNSLSQPAFFTRLVATLHWSAPWCVGLVLFTAAAAVYVLARWRHWNRLDPTQVTLLLATAFGLAGLAFLSRTAMLPYYLVYFLTWPMLAIAVAVERYPRIRLAFAVALLLWLPSASWNAIRIRELALYHDRLSKDFLFAELRRHVPADGTIVTAPDLYSVPAEAGYSRFASLGFYAEHDDACPTCYLLLNRTEFDKANFVARSNEHRRPVIYAGPAFPGARYLEYPVVLLGPEKPATSNQFQAENAIKPAKAVSR